MSTCLALKIHQPAMQTMSQCYCTNERCLLYPVPVRYRNGMVRYDVQKILLIHKNDAILMKFSVCRTSFRPVHRYIPDGQIYTERSCQIIAHVSSVDDLPPLYLLDGRRFDPRSRSSAAYVSTEGLSSIPDR